MVGTRANVCVCFTPLLTLLALNIGFGASAVFEVYNSTDSTTVCMRVDANFSISVITQEGQEAVGHVILYDFLKQNRSSCDDSRATLILGSSTSGQNTKFRFLFKRELDAVLLQYSFSFYPYNLFPGLPAELGNSYIGFTSIEKKISDVKSSYKCERKETVKLVNDSDVEAGAYMFSVKLVVKGIHAQAFNMQGRQFSRAVDCSKSRTNDWGDNTTVTVHVLVAVTVLSLVVVAVLILRRFEVHKIILRPWYRPFAA